MIKITYSPYHHNSKPSFLAIPLQPVENYILITNDKDFGELIFRNRKAHKGVILLRLENERTESKIAAIQKLLKLYSDKLPNNFVIVTEKTVRIVKH